MMMANKARFNPSTVLSNNDSLLIALLVAAMIHAIVILGVNFSTPKPEKINRSIDITLVNTPAKKAPKKAEFLAQDNQVGAGVAGKKPEPPAQKLPSKGNSEKKRVEKNSPEEGVPKAAQKIITRKKAEQKVLAASKAVVIDTADQRPHLSPETLRQQIAQLGTEIRLSRQGSDNSRIKFIESVSAHKYVAAQYINDWEAKVERTGNLNYPEVAAKKNFSSALTMQVGIRADGSIESMRINKSSGNPALDEAAKRIVRMSAPFAPLPMELQKELDVLMITRVWKFSDESGMTAR